MNRPYHSPRVLRSGLWLLTVLQIAALIVAFERPAHAYVDPGSGLLIFQGISAIFSGALFYFRRRLRNLFVKTPKGMPQSSRPL